MVLDSGFIGLRKHRIRCSTRRLGAGLFFGQTFLTPAPLVTLFPGRVREE